MILKFILGAVIVLAFTYVGYQIEKYYKTRLAVAEDYSSFVAYAERETEFMKTGICELMRKFGSQTDALKSALKECADTIEKTGEVLFECKALSKQAVCDVNEFLDALARSDYETRRNVIKNAYAKATAIKDTAVKEKTQKGELVRKLFILIGVGILIIVI